MMQDASAHLSASRNSGNSEWFAIKPALAISTEICSTTRRLSIQDDVKSA